MKKPKRKLRALWDVSEEELDKAILELVDRLNISGSIAGIYSLYDCIKDEWEKARRKIKEERKCWNELLKKG